MKQDITTILFRRLHQYVGMGLITRAQLVAIERHELNTVTNTPQERANNFRQRMVKDITEALNTTNGNRSSAAVLLGISDRTLYRYLKQFNIDQ